jgi:hypothetical protein
MTNNKPFNTFVGFAVPDDEHFYLVISHPALCNDKEEVVCLDKTYNNCYRVTRLFDKFEEKDEYNRETRTLRPRENNIFYQTLFSYTELKLRLNKLSGELNDYVRNKVTNKNLEEINKDFE